MSQTNIVNYKDFLENCFNKNISDHITHILLPLAISSPIDPIAMLNQQINGHAKNQHVLDFCNGLKSIVQNLEENGRDTGRIITTFKINLESVKKLRSADLTVSVDQTSKDNIVVHKKVDPNTTYPLSQMDIVTNKKDIQKKGKEIKYQDQILSA